MAAPIPDGTEKPWVIKKQTLERVDKHYYNIIYGEKTDEKIIGNDPGRNDGV